AGSRHRLPRRVALHLPVDDRRSLESDRGQFRPRGRRLPEERRHRGATEKDGAKERAPAGNTKRNKSHGYMSMIIRSAEGGAAGGGAPPRPPLAAAGLRETRWS